MICKTPEEMAYFRFASLKGMCKLEKVGLKSRGGAIRPKLAKELELSPRDSYDAFIAALQARMNILLENKRARET